MLKRGSYVMSLLFVLILVGCSSSLDKELSTYLEDVIFDTQEEAHDKMQETEQEYIKALEAGETEKVFTILEEKYLPEVEAAIEDAKSYEAEHEEVKELNNLVIEEHTALLERLKKQEEAFKLFLELETDEDLQAAVTVIDEVVTQSVDYVDARDAFDERLIEVVDENDPDVTVEIDEEGHEIDRDDVEAAIYNEFGWFVHGLEYNPDILVTGELEGQVGTVNSTNALQVEMIGEVIMEEGDYVVEGKSNLPGDAELEAYVYLHGQEVSKGHQAYTKDDGSFTIEIPDLDIQDGAMELQVKFRPADQAMELQEVYGEVGENMEGDYIYLYSSIKRKYHEAMMIAHFSANEKDRVAFEKPEWDRPADYGELDIWMEVEELEEHAAYYDVHVRSNFAEGTRIRGDIEVPGYDTGGFLESTDVRPDGSFDIQLQRPDVDEDAEVIVQLEMLPNSLIFAYTEDLYGLNGEYLQGDLVEKHKGGQKIHFEYSVQKGKQVKD